MTVRVGQSVRDGEVWRRVHSVRSEQYASGGLFFVVGLEDGPTLRLQAGDVVTVRTAGAHGVDDLRTAEVRPRLTVGPVNAP
ncbi:MULTISPECIES: hypothetical protein [unclassified Streptomyces]|uniref:hypothetical protein n=1 Tax=unclassified Streptomyces TaxID=2593676 RepID=UPI0037AA7F23